MAAKTPKSRKDMEVNEVDDWLRWSMAERWLDDDQCDMTCVMLRVSLRDMSWSWAFLMYFFKTKTQIKKTPWQLAGLLFLPVSVQQDAGDAGGRLQLLQQCPGFVPGPKAPELDVAVSAGCDQELVVGVKCHATHTACMGWKEMLADMIHLTFDTTT